MPENSKTLHRPQLAPYLVPCSKVRKWNERRYFRSTHVVLAGVVPIAIVLTAGSAGAVDGLILQRHSHESMLVDLWCGVGSCCGRVGFVDDTG
ncbi:hypothetical protein, partial [Nocardia farcinica]|uniref:hypothetical protein n=1 Tax=Nocardia farcinica TaxID=37329 RepID=UPI002453D40C